MVGDTVNDMNFAKNAGAIAVGMISSAEGRIILGKNADYIIEDISEVLSFI